MNTERDLFRHPGQTDLRKAVNFAIDRPAMTAQRGHEAGEPTDQMIPPTTPGFIDYDIYPLDGPDLDRARELAGCNPNCPPRTAVFYTCNTGPCIPTAQIVQANLAQIGIDATIVPYPAAVCFTRIGTRGEPFDLASCTGWRGNSIDAYEFIKLSDGATIRPFNNINWAYFDDPVFNARILAARRMAYGSARDNTLGQIDGDLARRRSAVCAVHERQLP